MRSKSLLLATLILAVVVAGCTSIGPQPTPVAPTKTPKPTFTPTPDWTPTPVVFATEAPVAAEPTAEAAAPSATRSHRRSGGNRGAHGRADRRSTHIFA